MNALLLELGNNRKMKNHQHTVREGWGNGVQLFCKGEKMTIYLSSKTIRRTGTCDNLTGRKCT